MCKLLCIDSLDPIYTIPSITIPLIPLLVASNFSPADGETEVALDKSITVDFNRDINESTLNTATFKIRPAGVIVFLSASRSYNALLKRATLNPTANLLPNTTYYVTLTDGIESTGGLPLFNAQTWSFKTISPPAVLTKTPAAGATNVPVDQTIPVTFDKNMDWSTVSASSFYLQKSGGGTIAATITKSVDKRTASINPLVDLEEGATYVVTLTTAVKAENGLSLESTVVWSFTTAADAPQVITKVPAHGATNVPVDQTISATFNKDMDASTLTSATFYIRKSGGSPLVATVAYNASTRTATLDPAVDLEEGEAYEVRLTTAVEGENGAPLAAAVVWTFTAAGAAPTVTTKVPTNGAAGVPVTQVISATFDKDMDASTFTSATFYIQKSGGSPLVATVAYSAGTRTATLDPAADLEAGATYQVTLSTAVEGADGQTLAGAPVVWNFTTAGGTSTFSDVPASHPYYTAISDLASRGIISGYGGGIFGPGDPVRRQQFAKMVVGSLGIPPNAGTGTRFSDLGTPDASGYPHVYVQAAFDHGITYGTNAAQTLFAPYNYITRYQVISMVVRAADDLQPGLVIAAPAGYGAWRNDSTHGANAARAEYNGLLAGLDLAALSPYGNMSRGEVAQVLHNLINLLAP